MSRYITKRNRCDCHPETCCHWPWITWDTVLEVEIGNGGEYERTVDKQTQKFNEKSEEIESEQRHYYG